MALKMTSDLKMTFKHQIDLGYGFLALKTMGKVAFHKALVATGAVIWHSLFRVAAILDFAQTGHRRSSSICLRWFLKTLCPHLTPCQITKTSHQVHDHPDFPLSYLFVFLFVFYIMMTLFKSGLKKK